MAPKRKARVKAVVTTKKVVEETVEVELVSSNENVEPPKGDDEEKRSGKRKRKRGGEGYKRYLLKVMKQVHPEMGISGKAITIINNLMMDMFERIAEEAARLQKYTGRRTMSSREVGAAVKLLLPGDLGKHAVAEGTKALTNYISYISPT